MKYKVKKVKNQQIVPFLSLDPVYNTYPLYICKLKPEEFSLAAIAEDGEIAAVLTTGRPDIYEAYGYWLTASNSQSAEVLLNEIKDEKDFDINYPLFAEALVRKIFPSASLSIDNLYVYTEGKIKKETAAAKLSFELFNSATVPKEFKGLLNANDLLPESKFWGRIYENTLCAIGERVIETMNTAAISQLMTLEGYRKKGFALDVVLGLTSEILKMEKLPVYLLSEENTASKKTCEKAGFKLSQRIGFAEN